MRHFLLITCLISVLLSGTQCQPTAEQQKELVDIHNYFRRQVAKGKVAGHPEASDMLLMKWNSDSSKRAQASASKCIFKHDTNKDRSYGNYKQVGQNIGYSSIKNISRVATTWFNEFTDYHYDSKMCNEKKVCGHYTQVVWANSNEVGCGVSQCQEKGMSVQYLFCNYGPAGNYIGQLPYKKGAACSKCPENTSCEDGLCKSKNK